VRHRRIPSTKGDMHILKSRKRSSKLQIDDTRKEGRLTKIKQSPHDFFSKDTVGSLHPPKVLKTRLITCYQHIAKYYRSFGTRIASTRNGGMVKKSASSQRHKKTIQGEGVIQVAEGKIRCHPYDICNFVCNL
jgi:hypothetical protein